MFSRITLASLFVTSSRFQALNRGYHSSILRSQTVSNEAITNAIKGEKQTKWLVVGDGDLSYSATIASQLDDSKISLVATVLEDESVHNQVYKRSVDNSKAIASYQNHHVKFGIDATKLEQLFPETKFDFIEFNFPHWRGKTNNRYNRELVDNFFRSAAKALQPDGEIRVALCDGQGGMPAESLTAWKQSWMVPMYGNNNGLLLKRLEPYDPSYGLSSHRGVDRPFSLGKTPQKYTFGLPSDRPIHKKLQISCRHELRIKLDPSKLEKSPVSFDEIVKGDAVLEFARQFIPEGIDFEIPARDYLTTEQRNGGVALAVFLLNYSGSSAPLERRNADGIRSQIETGIMDSWKLNIAKPGRLVSRPYPNALLSELITEHS
jgi:hypothetical protein